MVYLHTTVLSLGSGTKHSGLPPTPCKFLSNVELNLQLETDRILGSTSLDFGSSAITTTRAALSDISLGMRSLIDYMNLGSLAPCFLQGPCKGVYLLHGMQTR